jgi:hypothetical protein
MFSMLVKKSFVTLRLLKARSLTRKESIGYFYSL